MVSLEVNEDLILLCPEAKDYAVILWDLETTGTVNQQIVQIGCWEMINNITFDFMVKPNEKIDFNFGTRIHRFTDEDVIDALGWEIIGKKFLEWTDQFKNKKLIFISHGHTDSKWLQAECARVNLELPIDWIFADSCKFV